MKWVIFETEAEAYAYSHAEALRCGHGMPGNTIQYWWEIRQCADGRWAVKCPDGMEAEPVWKEENNETY